MGTFITPKEAETVAKTVYHEQVVPDVHGVVQPMVDKLKVNLEEEARSLKERLALQQSQISSQEIMLFDLKEEELKQLTNELSKRPTQSKIEYLISAQNPGPELQLEVMKI